MLPINRNQLITSILFIVLLVITYLIYLPGITGDFIFDDAPNLVTMAKYPNFSTWDNFLLFLLEGRSGPTGRPISLASFYLNDIAWPTEAQGFIRTNILIHLLNGVLVFLLISKLAKSLKFEDKEAHFLALSTTAFWLLHPFNSTTVLYVIQRMTELSSLFILIGLIFYITGRNLLFKTKTGLVTLFIGVGASLILSIFSKENGILLVAYIMALEFFLIRPLGNKPPPYFNIWFIPAVVIPFVLLLAYLFNIALNTGGYSHRDFTFYERILTEPRILLDYIYNIISPKISGTGLYHDDFVVSKGLLTPWTTLPVIVGILGLLFYAWIARKKQPFIAFAIIWFFFGHLLESTVIGLELYFEHRNYLPMLGILLALVYYLGKLAVNQPVITGLVFVFIISMLSFVTYEKSKLWGDPSKLLVSWSKDHPRSNRATSAYLTQTKKVSIRDTEILESQRKTISRLSANAALWSLAYTCETGTLTNQVITETTNIVKKKKIRLDSGNGLDQFTHAWFSGKCTHISSKRFEIFLKEMLELGKRDHNSSFVVGCHDALAKLYEKNRDLGKTITQLEISYKIKPSLTLLLKQAHHLATAGLYKEALEKLKDTDLLTNTFRKRMIFSITKKRIDFLKSEIVSHMDMKGVTIH